MNDQPDPNEVLILEKGYKLVLEGKTYAALNHFHDVASRTPVTRNTAVAMQTLGILHRTMKQLETSVADLEKALDMAQTLEETELEASILDDLKKSRDLIKPRRQKNRKV